MSSKRETRNSKLRESSVMEELLARHAPRGMRRGDVVSARVISISNRQVFLDLGGKSEGVVEGREYDAARDFIKTFKKGDNIKALVVIPETRSGLTLVSLRSQAEDVAFSKLEELAGSEETVLVTVKGAARGGLAVDFQGIAGFIPMSQLGEVVGRNLEDATGRGLEVRLIEVDRQRRRVLFSEREVSEREQIEKQREIISTLREGEVYPGEVVSILPFGAFVRISKNNVPIEGLLHSSRINQGLGFQVGSKVSVRIARVGDRKVAFDLGQPDLDISKYEKDQRISGRVSKVRSRSALVEIEPGVTAQLSMNTLPPGTTVRPGETYNFFIEGVNRERRKITLGLALKAKPVGYK